jgi:hypothetical protein
MVRSWESVTHVFGGADGFAINMEEDKKIYILEFHRFSDGSEKYLPDAARRVENQHETVSLEHETGRLKTLFGEITKTWKVEQLSFIVGRRAVNGEKWSQV